MDELSISGVSESKSWMRFALLVVVVVVGASFCVVEVVMVLSGRDVVKEEEEGSIRLEDFCFG